MDPEYMKQALLKHEEKETKLILDFLKLTKPSFYQYLETLQEKASKYDEIMESHNEEIHR